MKSRQQLEDRIGRLEAIVEAGSMLNSTLDLEQLVEGIIGIATRLVSAERGSLFLVDDERAVLRSLVAQGIDGEPLELEIGDGIVGSVAASGEPILLNDPYDDARFDATVDRITGFRTRSLLTVPVRDREGALTAVLQLLNHSGGGFTSADVSFLAELGVSFAVALATARMHREMLRKERLDEELRLAAEIQRALRPRDPMAIEGLDLESLLEPCHEVGGDYLDLIPRAGGRWWIVVADISGKGVAAGLIAANLQAYLWSRRRQRVSLARLMAEGNDLLFGLAEGVKYATLVIADWNPATRLLSWVNAGHPPMLVRRRDRVIEAGATGPPIGLLPDQNYEIRRVRLAGGDSFLLYTDGVLEAGGQEDAAFEFGIDRIKHVFDGDGACRRTVQQLTTAVRDYLDGDPLGDDLTILCARCTIER
jgi:sigma-B regulation protein RsbU (phosphoserine phosphatase)